MADTTDIEKKSLEAHVELCAERYKLLELKLESLHASGSSLKEMIADLHAMVQAMSAKRNLTIDIKQSTRVNTSADARRER